MSAAELLDGSIVDAAAALRRREVTAPELVAASLSRIDASRHLGAYVDVYADRALKIAEAHQALLQAGVDLGPLHGLPVALKDNIDLAGALTASGSSILKGNVSETDATVAARLKRAGAVVVGKTNLHEFAWGGTTDNPHFGPTRNPWNPDRSPAGSSGGSGAAVASRTVFTALGTDTGGSVRLPASMNGVSGIRPSIGRVSNAGVHPLAWSLDTVGPLAMGAADCAIVLEAMAGADPRDPQASARAVPPLLAAAGRGAAGMRIGVLEDYALHSLQTEVREAFLAAIETLRGLGAVVEPVAVPDLDELVDALVVVDAVEPSAHHAPWLRERPGDYGADVRANLEAGLAISGADYVQAQRYRAHVQARFAEAFECYDALLSPTLPFTAPGLGQTRIELDGELRDVLTGLMRFTALASVPGLPAASVPMGIDAAGMPIGLQIIAARFDEAAALRVAGGYQTASGWHRRRP